MNTIDQIIGENFKRLKNDAGTTDKDLAELLGIELGNIPLMEQGEERISAAQIWVLSDFFKAPVHAFFEGVN